MELSSVLQVTYNARGLGGIPTADGSAIAEGVLFRSDSLSALTDTGIEALVGLGIGTVVDLRTNAERSRSADALPQDGSISLIPLPVLGGAMGEMAKHLMPDPSAQESPTTQQIEAALDQVPTLEQLYRGILASSAPQFAALGRAVIAAAQTDRPGVIVHCTAGKDRTGLAVAILLLLAGVEEPLVVADYTETEKNLAGTFADSLLGMISGSGLPLSPRLRELATRSPARAIESAIDWIAEQHGDAAGYLSSGGLSPEEIVLLRNALRAAG